ncbi:hypothetical protein FB446DRAFT_745085 [Lentinula raphanica]|nr:hypothetical protein FB446DRAFT_745085 [Lentinula raphanica]
MDLGSNFASKLEPYLLMGKSMKGAAAAKLIQDATSAPGVFVFGELFELPGIRNLEKDEQHSKSYALLQLFAYKTYQDYLENKDQLPPLNQAQTTKLKHLSIVSMATERRILPYPLLMSSLAMSTVRDLEDLIIDAIYLDILCGKLDQKDSQLEVEYTMGGQTFTIASNRASTTSAVLSTLDSQLASLSSQTASNKERREEYEVRVAHLMKEINNKKDAAPPYSTRRAMPGGGHGHGQMAASSSGMAGGMGGDRMDVDEPEVAAGSKGKNRKAPQGEAKPSRKRNRL